MWRRVDDVALAHGGMSDADSRRGINPSLHNAHIAQKFLRLFLAHDFNVLLKVSSSPLSDPIPYLFFDEHSDLSRHIGTRRKLGQPLTYDTAF